MKSGMVMRIFSRSCWGSLPQSETGCTFTHLITSKFLTAKFMMSPSWLSLTPLTKRYYEDYAVESCFTKVLDGFHLGFKQVYAADELVNVRC